MEKANFTAKITCPDCSCSQDVAQLNKAILELRRTLIPLTTVEKLHTQVKDIKEDISKITPSKLVDSIDKIQKTESSIKDTVIKHKNKLDTIEEYNDKVIDKITEFRELSNLLHSNLQKLDNEFKNKIDNILECAKNNNNLLNDLNTTYKEYIKKIPTNNFSNLEDTLNNVVNTIKPIKSLQDLDKKIKEMTVFDEIEKKLKDITTNVNKVMTVDDFQKNYQEKFNGIENRLKAIESEMPKLVDLYTNIIEYLKDLKNTKKPQFN